LPDYHFLITVAMHLSIGLLYCYRGERILAMQFGEAALQITETYLHFDHDCLLICYNYLAVLRQLEDQYTEALSIYEKMLSIANEQNNTSALLGIYEQISLITCDSGDSDYELICLEKIAELKRTLGCENIATTTFEFGWFYEKKENFVVALYYYKQNFRCLLQQKAHLIDLMRTYSLIGTMYENLNYYSAALQIYIQILAIELVSLPFYDRSLLRKYRAVIKCIQRLIKCNSSKKLRYYFRLFMSSSSSSIFFIKFINKLKFLFYFELDHPIGLKALLNILLERILTEYHNRRMYENSLKKLQRLIQRFMKVRPPCFAKIYHNAQMLRKLRLTLDDYRRFLHLIQRAYFSTAYMNTYEAQKNESSIERCSTNIGRVIYAFTHSSHATLCQDRIQQKPRQRHRSSLLYQYRFCGCFKNSFVLRNRSTGRWVRFCKI
jgi:tetratricopeptide (TPR) repeat protein